MMTDPIADLLTRVRNGVRARKEALEVPWSRTKEEIVRVLCEEGFAREYSTSEDPPKKNIRVVLKYDEYRRPVITGIRRISRPSLRVYVKSREIPPVRKGLGV